MHHAPITTLAAAANATGLRVFFTILLVLVLCAGFYILRNRKKFFAPTGESDSYASANLRMWLVILVWVHAVIITALMIFEV